MPSDVMIDEVGRRIRVGGATDNNDATAEICAWCEYAETEQAGVASTVPYLRLGAEFKELVTELRASFARWDSTERVTASRC